MYVDLDDLRYDSQVPLWNGDGEAIALVYNERLRQCFSKVWKNLRGKWIKGVDGQNQAGKSPMDFLLELDQRWW